MSLFRAEEPPVSLKAQAVATTLSLAIIVLAASFLPFTWAAAVLAGMGGYAVGLLDSLVLALRDMVEDYLRDPTP